MCYTTHLIYDQVRLVLLSLVAETIQDNTLSPWSLMVNMLTLCNPGKIDPCMYIRIQSPERGAHMTSGGANMIRSKSVDEK